MKNFIYTTKACAVYCFIMFGLSLVTAQTIGWQRHEAPSPVWQLSPRIEKGNQIGLLIGCQNHYVYALDSSGNIDWSFDTGGQPSQIVSADLDGNGTWEVIVTTHDTAGTIYILSDEGSLLKSYVHGVPFSSVDVSTNGTVRIVASTYDSVIYFFDKNLNIIKKNVWDKPDTWYQSVKVGDVSGDGNDEAVVVNLKGVISVFNTDGALLAHKKIGGGGKRADLFLVNINSDSKKEIIVMSAGVVTTNYAVEYANNTLNELWNFDQLGTSTSMTLVDDFLPASGLDILCYNPYIFGNKVHVNGLSATGINFRNKKDLKKNKMHLPLCMALSLDKATILAGSVGTRDNSYYTIAGSNFQSENYPLLPEVNFSTPALNALAAAVKSIPAHDMIGEKPYVVFLRGYVNGFNQGYMDGWSDVMKAFEVLAPHVKVVIEFPVDTKTKMTHQELMDFTDMLESQGIPFTYEMSSGSSPSNISIAEMEEVLERAPKMCYGFAVTENGRYARNPNDPWKKVFFPMVLEVAELCKAHSKIINVQENQAGWQVYAGDPDVISQWFSPELKGTVIPIVRNNSNGAYLAINALLGLEAAGFSDGWGVSIQDWMWVKQGKHQLAGMVPRELMTRSNMMAAALGARYFQFEAGTYAFEDMERITKNPNAPYGLEEDGVFFQYLRKGVFSGYHSSELKNLSTHAIGLGYNDDLWLQIENQWFLGMWDFNANSDLNSGVLGQHTALQPLPEKNIYKHLYGVEYNRSNTFKTPYGLAPIVPTPYSVREDGVEFDLIKTDRHVFLGEDVKYQNVNTLFNTFEAGAVHHPFRTEDAFLATYKHQDGYLLYLIGTEYFDLEENSISIDVNDTIEAGAAVDYLTGEAFEIEGNKIVTSLPGGVMRVLQVNNTLKTIDHELVDSMKIYPNPADNELNIQFKEEPSIDTNITIFDSLGRVVNRVLLHSTQQKIDVSPLSTGLYFIEVEGRNKRQKIIVK